MRSNSSKTSLLCAHFNCVSFENRKSRGWRFYGRTTFEKRLEIQFNVVLRSDFRVFLFIIFPKHYSCDFTRKKTNAFRVFVVSVDTNNINGRGRGRMLGDDPQLRLFQSRQQVSLLSCLSI